MTFLRMARVPWTILQRPHSSQHRTLASIRLLDMRKSGVLARKNDAEARSTPSTIFMLRLFWSRDDQYKMVLGARELLNSRLAAV
jgi:hypothetical protein